ncbi:GNAT family N-acetyltransferase [Streptococcus thoraltensis]|uniref:GNAT family N-acetyltransferase n=1 Tax=Streptococcus thoraltensis TaxID=55085 RepID=UPI0004776BDE|nr:GNAT family N-acetyltransferase [Streptococcus thoraltensis]MDY4760756.1 GNAT family N-acetyltransferase [Streptococcus thoraltensis]
MQVIVSQLPYQRAASLYIRFCVFVIERNIKMEEEFDENDEQGTVYAVLYDGKKPISTGRFLPETQKKARLTRIATLKDYRGKGYGTKIITALENYAKENGYQQLVIHAELTAKLFYQRLGYKAFGDSYIEDGEACQSLEKRLT